MITEMMVPPAAPAPPPAAKPEPTEDDVAVMRRLIADYEARKADEQLANDPMRQPRGVDHSHSRLIEANDLDKSVPELISMLEEIRVTGKARGGIKDLAVAHAMGGIARLRQTLMFHLHEVSPERFPIGLGYREVIEIIRRGKK